MRGGLFQAGPVVLGVCTKAQVKHTHTHTNRHTDIALCAESGSAGCKGHPKSSPVHSWGAPEAPPPRATSDPPLPLCPQILLLAFLKVIDEGSHMVMLECPETVNTLLHEFLLWEPEPLPSEEAPPAGKK